MSIPPLLTEEEAAKALHMSTRTLRDIRRHGQIRYVALSARKIAYRPEDCDEYVASCVRVEQATPAADRPGSAKPVRRGQDSVVIVPFTQRKR